MAKADLLFLNNKAMEACGVLDMREAIKDVEATYVLTEKGALPFQASTCQLMPRRPAMA